MKMLEWFIKRKAEADQELAKLSGGLDKLNDSRQVLEEQIAAAIDEEKLSVVEKLTAQEAELDNRIRAAEKILERKKEKSSFNREELAAAWNDELQKSQEDYNSTMAEAREIKRQYFMKILEAAKVVAESRGRRLDYLKFANAKLPNSSPYEQEICNLDFKTINATISKRFTSEDEEMIRGIDPDALRLIRTI